MKVYESRKAKKLFEAEGYTDNELKNFYRHNDTIQSRIYEELSYFISEGKIIVLNKRLSIK